MCSTMTAGGSASFETADDAKSAEATILKFCRLLENLSDEARGVVAQPDRGADADHR